MMTVRALILVVSMVVAVCAQAQTDGPQSRKFDEFSKAGHCDLTARLDNFAIQLQNEADAVGHIVAYGPEGEGFRSGRFYLELLKEYLLNTRGIAERRINTIYAGRNKDLHEPKIELWISPRGVSAPELPRFETNIDTFKGRFSTEQASDYVDILWEGEEEMGPGLGHTTDAAVADLMQQQKKAIAYIVTYNGEDAVPGASRRLAARRLAALKEHKVDVSRVKTLFGGVRKKTEIELWITAPGDPPPVKDAGPEPPPRKNAELTNQDDGNMGNPENERIVFNRVLDVLRDQPTVKIVAIVELQVKEPEPEPEEESIPVAVASPPVPESEPVTVEEERPRADLPKMVQKWREELINTHKIRPDRIIVLFTTGDTGNYIMLWAMPPGQPLPDPNADDEEEKPSDVVEDPKRRP